MSSPSGSSTWADRRALFQKGKVLHEPGRRPSGSGDTAIAEQIRRASVSSIDKNKTAAESASPPASPANRRGSTASSSGGGLFSNLSTMKRGSQDYGERRASHSDQAARQGGLVSGWWNSTMKGHGPAMAGGKVQQQQQQQQGGMGGGAAGTTAKEQKRGVME